jgi:predicted nucleic acid-binding protein
MEKCIDANVALKWVIKGEPYRRRALKLLHDATRLGVILIAPPMYEYEVESVLQSRFLHKKTTLAEVDASLAFLEKVGVQLITMPTLVKRAREIARKYNQPQIYDSLYAALAELRGCEFWTADKKFCDAIKGGLPFVKYLAHYQ